MTAYWELWYASESLVVEQSSLELLRSERDIAQRRVDTGGLAPADLLAFETKLATQLEAVRTPRSTGTRKSRLARPTRRGGSGHPAHSDGDPGTPPPPPSDAGARAERASPQMAEEATSVALAEIQPLTAADATRPRLDVDAWIQAQGIGDDDAAQAVGQLGKLGAVSAHVVATSKRPSQAVSIAPRRRARPSRSRARRPGSSRPARVCSAASTPSANAKPARGVVSSSPIVGPRRAASSRRREREAHHRRSSVPLNVLQAESDLRSAKLRVLRARVDLVEAAVNVNHLIGALIARYGVRLDARAAGLGGRAPRFVLTFPGRYF